MMAPLGAGPRALLLLGLALLSSAQHHRWSAADYPNPQKEPLACGRPGVAKSSVCDPERILSPEAADMVEGLINEISDGAAPFRKAACGDQGERGFKVAVALMHRMEHTKHADKAQVAASLARALHEAWGVGDAACQNGALLLLAVGDRQVYISTGRGVKDVVPDTQLETLLDNIRPALKHKRYADAVLQAVQQLGLLVSGQQPEPSGVDADDGWGIFVFFCAIVAAVVAWAAHSNRRQSARFKRCADRLESIKRDQAAIRARQYAATSCPICLEDFDQAVNAGGAGGSGSSAAGGGDDDAAPSAPLLSSGGGSGGASSSSAAAAAASSSAAAAAAGLGRSGSSAKRSAGKGSVSRKPLVLRCGHAFCDPCISQWLKSHTNCPICRKGLEDDDQPPETQAHAPASCAAGAQPPPDALQQQVWLPELGFRLRRLRMLYPDFVTDPMLYAWEEDLAAGRNLDTGVVQQFEARNPARQQQLQESGHGGASSSASFGGGSSWGGGGRGTSW